ncbi:hypothetical protein [Nonomuraea sp. B19D2]|uniref:hypothetical protein n=1 Tax=Nonomuraea sp. B19D2 TaxID=3159561 RepID=UPI0032DB1537
MPVNDNNPKGPNAATAATTPPSTLDAERGDLLTALATARPALTTTVRGLGDEQLGELSGDEALRHEPMTELARAANPLDKSLCIDKVASTFIDTWCSRPAVPSSGHASGALRTKDCP